MLRLGRLRLPACHRSKKKSAFFAPFSEAGKMFFPEGLKAKRRGKADINPFAGKNGLEAFAGNQK
jgi:hypothetical protein